MMGYEYKNHMSIAKGVWLLCSDRVNDNNSRRCQELGLSSFRCQSNDYKGLKADLESGLEHWLSSEEE
jgi:hypothetical protein